MRHDDPPRSRTARAGPAPPEPTPAENAVLSGVALAVSAWLVTQPTALVAALVALGLAVLLVGVPFAVVRLGVRVSRAVDERTRDVDAVIDDAASEVDVQGTDAPKHTAPSE